ncbi:MAG: N-acetylmuramoyl-L-alanine amidase [Frankiaceae bacterium]|nr:N-acetylmuramoyl-L-alanine amidase [Frankiaceae bacterium]MDQ1635463.1 N-acetylmuramoyl-L-alanine amidase [Frankiaceae bacterium]MDQ1650462.1 N-acetylmuramoyl-L-alanine amidase [Frankiaceae bacterium]MDQ1673770.1 N-acetylmuramoyl-L-alanine amidase [Frankiaceae bacterium]
MQLYRRGFRGPAVRQLRTHLADLGLLLAPGQVSAPDAELFDDVIDEAVRSFQQSRGLRVDGIVGPDTTRALDEARRSLGDRLLYHSISHPFVGDDVLELQSRMADMGFDVGRVDGIFGARTEFALREFQRNRGLSADGACGPLTLRELTRLQRTVVGGRPYELREAEQLRSRGPSLAGKTVVLDPGHGGSDPGWQFDGLTERDLMHDLASQIEGRLLAVGVNAFLTHHRRENPTDDQRSATANETDADLLVSLHTDGAASPRAQGVATYYFGTGRTSSVVGERFAELVHREIVARTDLVDCRTHAKSWDMLRRTRMPAVRLDLGYLTNAHDARALASRDFRATVAEGILAAVQRIFLPPDLDPPTGQWRLPESLRG